MKLIFLGTCAGTEPMPERKHTSFALEVNGDLYWFDAGEGCSYTAHNMGLDVLRVKKILISHPHLDHTGGLANLIWNIRKMHWVKSSENIGKICFTHNGREILNHPAESDRKVQGLFGEKAVIASDGMTEQL